mmetsp:Transcript_34950/g.96653  ORF Transcript_34950/g.96653 Transcript_34950/m.96653 type:complete len:300 (-) Transcript_34950:14-913(-)
MAHYSRGVARVRVAQSHWLVASMTAPSGRATGMIVYRDGLQLSDERLFGLELLGLPVRVGGARDSDNDLEVAVDRTDDALDALHIRHLLELSDKLCEQRLRVREGLPAVVMGPLAAPLSRERVKLHSLLVIEVLQGHLLCGAAEDGHQGHLLRFNLVDALDRFQRRDECLLGLKLLGLPSLVGTVVEGDDDFELSLCCADDALDAPHLWHIVDLSQEFGEHGLRLRERLPAVVVGILTAPLPRKLVKLHRLLLVERLHVSGLIRLCAAVPHLVKGLWKKAAGRKVSGHAQTQCFDVLYA